MDFPTSSAVNVLIHEEVEPLWRMFSQKTNEMIISKSGRKMFPNIEFKVAGLHPEMNYVFVLKFSSDKRRYRYSCQEWTSNSNEKFKDCEDTVLHTDGAQNGQKWMDHPVSFDFVRLTNDSRNKNTNTVFLQSLHKYRPVLEIYSIPSVSNGNIALAEFNQMQDKMRVYTSGFDLMDFVAVTAYQNKEINDLKKENNKYASAFKAKEMKEKEKKEAEKRICGGANNQMQNFANQFMPGQNPYQPFFNYPQYFWNNPAAMMNQFGPFGQMPNQFAPGPVAQAAAGQMPNLFGGMPGYPGAMPNMNLPNGMPTAPWPQQNPATSAAQACVAQAPPTFGAQSYPNFAPHTQFMMPPTTPVQQVPPLTPTSSNQSTSSNGASPVEPAPQNQMMWPNYNQNMMGYGMVPQGKPQLALQNPFNNLTNITNYNTSPPVNNNNNNNML